MTPSLGLLLAVLLHPVHETVSEVEWNAETGRLEVAVRLSVLDEQWIGRRSRDEKIEVWATKYLKSHFRVQRSARDVKQTPAEYHWVGRQQQGAFVWWYFEIQPPDKTRPTIISQRMLFDRDRGYVNRVVVLGRKTRQAVTLTHAHPEAPFNPTP